MEKTVQFTSRLPAELMSWLKEKSAEHDRSVNGQLVRTLREAKNLKEKLRGEEVHERN